MHKVNSNEKCLCCPLCFFFFSHTLNNRLPGGTCVCVQFLFPL